MSDDEKTGNRRRERTSDDAEVVTVKFRTDANETTLTHAFDLKTNVAELRSYLSRSLNVDPGELVVELPGDGTTTARPPLQRRDDGRTTLETLGATSLGTFELRLRGRDGVPAPRRPAYYVPAVDVITVYAGRKPSRRPVVVEIERCAVVKPWLGGYRDRGTGRAYHHAAAQTDFRPKIHADVARADGRSQTCADAAVGRDAAIGAGTQTTGGEPREGCSRTVTARRYRSYGQTCREREDRALSAALGIQRAFRSRTAARAPKPEQKRSLAAELQERPDALQPQTALESKQQHFYSLCAMIGKWWKRERQRIRQIEAENSRRAAQMNLLKNEIKFLLEMEKQRSELKYELTKHDDVTFLNKTSEPKMFKNKTGKLLTMDTVGNQKARALREIHAKCCAAAAPTTTPAAAPDRARALDELYAAVSESGYKHKKDLLDAIAMEKGLAAMRADPSSVRSVRARVELMFRHFIRQPDVNPEADSYYRPSEKRVLNVYTCIRCKRNLAATDFSLESRVNRTNVCAACEWTEQVGHKRIDMAPYRRMLKALRHDEMQKAAYESECFLMQPTEVYRLVSVVWRERSAVGESGQLNGLRLVRWRPDEAWSPWNCILLTRPEAEAHSRLDGDPADCYGEQFVRWVANRHMMARLQFGNLVQAVKSRKVKKKVKPLSKNWKTVADNFNIKPHP